MTTDPSTPPVTHLPEQCRFEIRPAGAPAPAYLSYAVEADRVVFDHTCVPEPLRGRGIAADLVRAALAEARRAGWKIVPACSYVAAFIDRHPEFTDILDPSHKP